MANQTVSMRIIFLVSIMSVFFSAGVQGQSYARSDNAMDAYTRLKNKEISGDVSITMDSLVLDNYYKHLVYNAKNRGIEGYRIRIFSDNGYGAKDQQLRIRASFLSQYPEIKTYSRYEGSYYKIYVGDFRTKRDALRALNKINENFPDGFIVEDKIVIEE